MESMNFRAGNFVRLKNTATEANGRIIPYDTKHQDFQVCDVDNDRNLVQVQSLDRNGGVDKLVVRASDVDILDDRHWDN
ncbi:MAG: hypothetical protein K6D38_07610 [Pseudobutyrivibrio sp.]|nr:hypothetical protein [Pseudobutyrivibrio sp.]